jgi:hypothetical protein
VIKRILLSAVAISTIIAAGSAQAATVTQFKLKDHSLLANFEAASDDGCYVAETTINFAESVIHFDGTKFVGVPTTLIEVDYANACTGDVLSLAGGTTTQTFQILGDLSSASLSAVIPVTDGVNSATVTINMTLTANSPVQTAKGHFRSSNGNETDVDNFNISVRNADDAGSVTTTLPLAAGPSSIQLAQFPQGGTIGSVIDGERTITTKN